jgi:hypothetical protein
VRDNTASWRLAIALASQRNAFPHPVRHFGISVLESGIKYFWLTFNEDETIAIRHGLLHLCGEVVTETTVLMQAGRHDLAANISHRKTRIVVCRVAQTDLAGFLGRSIAHPH